MTIDAGMYLGRAFGLEKIAHELDGVVKRTITFDIGVAFAEVDDTVDHLNVGFASGNCSSGHTFKVFFFAG